MAAPTESGYGLGEREDAKTLDIDEVKRQGPKIVSAGAGEEGEGVEKNGSEACPEDAGSDEKGDEQVAKKPRVEKAENGGADQAGDAGYGVASLDGAVDKDGGDGENEGVNGGGEEGEEEENGAGEEHAGDGATAKDAAPGDVGLRTLLQEGDDTKTSVVHHGADATHMLNAAK